MVSVYILDGSVVGSGICSHNERERLIVTR